MYDIFIKNGEVILPENRKQKLNIGIKNSIISLITTKNDYACKTLIDAKNLTIIPGVIDSQVHFREPGSVHKEEHYNNVFKPFYRIESSRNLSTGGLGLGMTIARDIARSNGGDVKLDKSPLGGLRVVLSIPI